MKIRQRSEAVLVRRFHGLLKDNFSCGEEETTDEARRFLTPKGVTLNEFFMRKIILIILLFAFCFLPFGCSIPNLQSDECQQAVDPVKRFYSYHFGNDMKNTPENLKKLSEFLSADLQKRLANQTETATDYFTQTDDYPKAFRVGDCQTVAPDRVKFGILLFWKTETRSEQRKTDVEAVKENEKWLVDKVSTAAE